MSKREVELEEKLKLADKALSVMRDYFFPPDWSDEVKQTFGESVPDDNGWFYVRKETADEFKFRLAKYVLK